MPSPSQCKGDLLLPPVPKKILGLAAVRVQTPPPQPLLQGKHHIPGDRGWGMVDQGQESLGGLQSHPLGMHPAPALLEVQV